jgi:hypothetical protein
MMPRIKKDMVLFGVIWAVVAVAWLTLFLVGKLQAQGVSGCGGVSASSACRPTIPTVAGLPTCNGGSQGQMYMVANASSPTALATVAGGGAVIVGVTCAPPNWIVE